MALKRIGDLSQYRGKFKDHKGEERHRRFRAGNVLRDSDNPRIVKIKVEQITPDWDGWLDLYLFDGVELTGNPKPRSKNQDAQHGQSGGADIDDDDIPF